MARLLPVITNWEDFYRERARPLEDWLPAVTTIAQSHGLKPGTISRFTDGESPVFALGHDFIVKLLPGFAKGLAKRETDLLTFLKPHARPLAPRLLAHGPSEDWYYLITTRITGKPLQHVWPEIPVDQGLRLAREYGLALADLHALPQADEDPGGIAWDEFCRSSITNWSSRPDFSRLPPVLQADGPRYLKTHGEVVANAHRVLLHGDLAPVNLIVRPEPAGWVIAGLIDFGNAMRGDPWFDLTAASVLLQPGDRKVVHAMLNGYANGTGDRLTEIRPSLMVNTLIHPMGDLVACLSLVPGLAQSQTWDEVAARFWPD
jgi:aminoglycoside phosphotransferase (APT) family kinase protein